jgi:cytochrome c5
MAPLVAYVRSEQTLPEVDKKNIDIILLTIGLLIGIAVGLFVIARDVGNENTARMQMNDPAFQAAVNERIKPYGRVVLDGEKVADEADVARVVDAEAAAAVMTGPQVYNVACLACHGGGIGGAPATGDAAAWGPRIAQGQEMLYEHALAGFQGEAGFMPPKGGRVDLSDGEITAAVDYLVEQAQ